jgi:uncharacterized membrane protein
MKGFCNSANCAQKPQAEMFSLCGMWKRLFLTPLRFKPHTRLLVAITGVVLVHVAAYFLFTATAPYMGSFLGIVGLAMYLSASRQSAKKRTSKAKTKLPAKRYYYLKA